MPLVINGEPIDENLVEQEFTNIKSAYERLDPTVQCCERDGEFRGYAQDNVIARVLLTQEARRTVGPPPAAEVDDAVAKIKEEHGGEEQFRAAFNLMPEQDDLVRQDVELNLRVQNLLDREIGPPPDPADAPLREYYNAHMDDYMNPERVRASHILKVPQRGEEREAMYNELRALRSGLLDGADFEEAARNHSDKAREQREAAGDGDGKDGEDDGIDLGYFRRGELMEEFEVVAFSMRVGEVSPVFGTSFGLHIVKLTDRIDATPKPFEEVRDEVRQAYLEEDRTEKVQTLVEQLKAKAAIENGDS